MIADDVRFANEAAAVRALGGIVVRLERPGIESWTSHASELFAFEPDATVVNDGNRAQLGRRLRAALTGGDPHQRSRRAAR